MSLTGRTFKRKVSKKVGESFEWEPINATVIRFVVSDGSKGIGINPNNPQLFFDVRLNDEGLLEVRSDGCRSMQIFPYSSNSIYIKT